jgi:hypothetical protein
MNTFCAEWKSPYKRIQPTKQTFLERIALAFIKEEVEVDEIENTTTVYKKFGHKVFIICNFQNPPKSYNCRHKINLKK